MYLQETESINFLYYCCCFSVILKILRNFLKAGWKPMRYWYFKKGKWDDVSNCRHAVIIITLEKDDGMADTWCIKNQKSKITAFSQYGCTRNRSYQANLIYF